MLRYSCVSMISTLWSPRAPRDLALAGYLSSPQQKLRHASASHRRGSWSAICCSAGRRKNTSIPNSSASAGNPDPTAGRASAAFRLATKNWNAENANAIRVRGVRLRRVRRFNALFSEACRSPVRCGRNNLTHELRLRGQVSATPCLPPNGRLRSSGSRTSSSRDRRQLNRQPTKVGRDQNMQSIAATELSLAHDVEYVSSPWGLMFAPRGVVKSPAIVLLHGESVFRTEFGSWRGEVK